MTKATDARGWLIEALAALGLGLTLFSLTIGPAGLSGERVIAALFGGGDAIDRAIVIDLRLPRALLALLRSEEHTSELQSLMRISYAVFCLIKKKQQQNKS